MEDRTEAWEFLRRIVYRALSALMIRIILLTWAVGPGFYNSRRWRLHFTFSRRLAKSGQAFSVSGTLRLAAFFSERVEEIALVEMNVLAANAANFIRPHSGSTIIVAMSLSGCDAARK